MTVNGVGTRPGRTERMRTRRSSRRCLVHSASIIPPGFGTRRSVSTDGGTNPLTATPAFAEFLREIGDRAQTGPDASAATLVGSYRFWPTHLNPAAT